MNRHSVLIVVDVQNDFMEGGALAVPGANLDFVREVVALSKQFKYVVATQDWHPQDHWSFASNWDMEPFSKTIVLDEERTLWPNHCVQHTIGADLHAALTINAQAIIRKGWRSEYDSYSGFKDEEDQLTGLTGWLEAMRITHITVCGLALEYCVRATALDAINSVYSADRVSVALRACRALGDPTDTLKELQLNGIKIV